MYLILLCDEKFWDKNLHEFGDPGSGQPTATTSISFDLYPFRTSISFDDFLFVSLFI